MAIRKEIKKDLKCVSVICSFDDAIDKENSDHDEYRKTLDTKHLTFLPGLEPTVFVCNFEVSGKEAGFIKNSMLDGSDSEGKPKIALGTWGQKIVQYCLKEIKNPSTLPIEEHFYIKREGFLIADSLIAELERAGVVMEIFSFYTEHALGGAKANAKN